MASITSVSVLAPNGRRQVVKVTPNTTILQILEEVCRKQGFKSDAFELRHQNRSLDLTAVIRFSGLPNLASLEMAEAAKARTETAVSLVLQLESGKRVSGEFMPTANLWHVLAELAPGDQNASAAVVYLRREVSGASALQRTTLRDLGLTGGRALLRLVPAATEGPRQQANVSAPLVRTGAIVPAATAPGQPMEVDKPHRPQIDVLAAAHEQQRQQAAAKQERERQQAAEAQERERQHAEAALERQRQHAALAQERERQQALAVLERQRQQELAKEMQSLEQQIVVVGARDAVVFRASSTHAVQDEPDDFFEPTVEDARLLYRDLRQAVSNMADAPLLTSAARERVQQNELVPAVIRVQFPDRSVLQATFRPTETVGDVLDFVGGHLVDGNASFSLFTTPPRVELRRDATLREVGCAGNCLLHFAPGPGANGTGFLRFEAATSAAGAALLASRVRGVVPSVSATTRPLPHASHAPSTSHTPSTSHAPRASHAPTTGHVPKWFKPA